MDASDFIHCDWRSLRLCCCEWLKRQLKFQNGSVSWMTFLAVISFRHCTQRVVRCHESNAHWRQGDCVCTCLRLYVFVCEHMFSFLHWISFYFVFDFSLCVSFGAYDSHWIENSWLRIDTPKINYSIAINIGNWHGRTDHQENATLFFFFLLSANRLTSIIANCMVYFTIGRNTRCGYFNSTEFSKHPNTVPATMKSKSQPVALPSKRYSRRLRYRETNKTEKNTPKSIDTRKSVDQFQQNEFLELFQLESIASSSDRSHERPVEDVNKSIISLNSTDEFCGFTKSPGKKRTLDCSTKFNRILLGKPDVRPHIYHGSDMLCFAFHYLFLDKQLLDLVRRERPILEQKHELLLMERQALADASNQHEHQLDGHKEDNKRLHRSLRILQQHIQTLISWSIDGHAHMIVEAEGLRQKWIIWQIIRRCQAKLYSIVHEEHIICQWVRIVLCLSRRIYWIYMWDCH